MQNRFAMRSSQKPVDIVVRRMRALSPLSETEQDLLSGLNGPRRQHDAQDTIAELGEARGTARFLVSGWACRERVLADGRRQIFSLLLPGDPIDTPIGSTRHLTGVVALTAAETIEAAPADEAVKSPGSGLARAFAAFATFEQKLVLDHVVRLGRQSAYERMAHFLLELQHRLQIVGLGDSQRFPLPLTQEILADALGLSIVHVNRTLQQLRRDRLIELRSGVAILLHKDQLAQIANYPLTATASPGQNASRAGATA